MKNKIITAVMLLFFGTIQAQENANNLYFNIGGGSHSINYKTLNGNVNSGIGFTGNMGYNHFFGESWGIGTGIGLQSFRARSTHNYMSTNRAVDTDGTLYDYRIYYTDWQETEKMVTLDIPIGFVWRKKIGSKSGLLISFGEKTIIPVNSSYKMSGGQIDTKGYFSQWNVELFDMPQHNFSTITSLPQHYFSAKPTYALYADLGGLHKLSERTDLYYGAYINYGLNNLLKTDNQFVYQEDGVYNGVLGSTQALKAKLISFGLKVGINLQMKMKEKVIPKEPVVMAKVVQPKVVPETPIPETKPSIPETKPSIPETKEIGNKEVTIGKKEEYELAKEFASKIIIYFPFNKAIPINIPAECTKLADLLKKHPNMELDLVGHTCNLGSMKVNIKLGLNRAMNVKAYFVGQGVPEKQISCDTKSYLEPQLPNTTIDNRTKNRRVVLQLQE